MTDSFNVDDKEPLEMERFVKNIFGKLYADRGYISQRLAQILFVYRGIANISDKTPAKDKNQLKTYI